MNLGETLMTPELTYLLYSIILLFVIVFIQASAGMVTVDAALAPMK